MPAPIDGYELTGTILRGPNAIKVLAVSAALDHAELYAANRSGAHAVLRKPPRPSGIVERDWLEESGVCMAGTA